MKKYLLAYVAVLSAACAGWGGAVVGQIKPPYPAVESRSPIAYNTADATQYAGADACAKITAAAVAQNAANVSPQLGGIIDARGFAGTQACTTALFASWPASPFYATVLLGAVVLETPPFVIPTRNSLIGDVAPYGETAALNGGATGGGTVIKANAAFPSATATVTTPVASPGVVNWTAHGLTAGQGVVFSGGGTFPTGITVGQTYYVLAAGLATNAFEIATTPGGTAINFTVSSSGAQTGSTVTPLIAMGALTGVAGSSYNVTVKNIGIDCTNPSATAMIGSIGIQNLASQQNTRVDNLNIWGCYTGILIADDAVSMQLWSNISVNDYGLPTGAGVYHCLTIGAVNEARQLTKKLDFNGLSCQTYHVTTPDLILLDGFGYSLRHVYFEYDATNTTAINYINIASQNVGYGVGLLEIADVTCDGNPVVTQNADCIHITTTYFPNSPMEFTNIVRPGSGSSGVWNILNDPRTPGCVVPGTADGGMLGWYFHRGTIPSAGTHAIDSSSSACAGPVVTNSTVAAPTAPASTSAYKMQGLAGTITPKNSGIVSITISGTVVAPAGTTAGLGILYQLSYGTGTAPSNTGTLTGVQVGLPQQYENTATVIAADVHIPFSISWVGNVTGTCALATACWIDLAAESVGTASDMGLANINITASEL